jgi:hypothetical protein
MDVKKYYRLW